MTEAIWIGIASTVGAAAIIGGATAAWKLFGLLVSMDFSLKSLTGQNEVIVKKIEGHDEEIGVLKVDVAEIRGTLHGIQKREPT